MEKNQDPKENDRGDKNAHEILPRKAETSVWLRLFRIAVVTAVLVSLSYLVDGSVDRIRESEIWLRRIDFAKLGLALFAYLGAMLLSALFWVLILRSFGHRPGLLKSLAAFFVSQFGKYVPGKAMVIVIRSDMIRDENLTATQAAASVLIETLTWIFVGSMIASALAFWQLSGQPLLQISAIVLAAITGLLTFPPVANGLASKFIRGSGSNPFHGLSLKTLTIGWTLMSVGWCLNGLSLWLVVASIPGAEPLAADFWLTLTSVSIATVLGFVSLVPGGLGVRELAIIPLLTPRFGAPAAIFAAVMIRLVWLSAIVLGSVIIYGVNKLVESLGKQ